MFVCLFIFWGDWIVESPSHDFFFSHAYPNILGPTIGEAVVCSKLVDGRWEAQSPIALVDLAIRSFAWFSPKLSLIGLASIRKTPKGALPQHAQVPQADNRPQKNLQLQSQPISNIITHFYPEKKYLWNYN